MTEPAFSVSMAADDADVAAAQRLRYRVFVEELGGDGPLVDHRARRERDPFDPVCRHLVLRDMTRPEGDRVVGAYRLLDRAGAARIGRFYSEDEYDLSALRASGRRLLELGRSCLHPEYRGGLAMYHLWNALAEVIRADGIDILFGVASFHGTDVTRLAGPLSILHHRHLAPAALRPVARPPQGIAMDLLAEDRIDRPAAMRRMPALIKAYLRLGGTVGQGAWVDHQFNTTDICLLVETDRLTDRGRAIYARSLP